MTGYNSIEFERQELYMTGWYCTGLYLTRWDSMDITTGQGRL